MNKIFVVLFLLILLMNLPNAKAERTTYHNIVCDGDLSEWTQDEYLGEDAYKQAYFTWNSSSIFLGWNGTAWNGEGDLFVYINTTAGGSANTYPWNSQSSHSLPFNADYFLAVEEGFSVHLYKYTTQWTEITYSGKNYIGWTENRVTEVEIPLSDIGNPSEIDLVIFAQWESEDRVWASFPTANPSSNFPTVRFYSYYHFVLSSGVAPSDPANIINTVSENNPPEVIIKNLQEGEVINTTSCTIIAEAYDDTDIDSLWIYIDGEGYYMYGYGNGSWSYLWSNYSVGEHNIKVYAYDVCGNSATAEVNVTYAGGHEVNPNAINLAIVWHMHQPLYKDMATGEYLAPWSRVHIVQEYIDHAFILQRHPNIKVTINLVPSLLYQIEDVARGNLSYKDGKYILENYTDPHLELALKTLNYGVSSLSQEEREKIETEFFWIADWVFKDSDPLNKYYASLAQKVDEGQSLTDQEILDLEVSYFLLQISKPLIKGEYGSEYMDKRLWSMLNRTGGFSKDDLAYVIQKQFDIARMVIPLYRSIKNVEFTISPYYHPIMPLLLKPGWKGEQSGIYVKKGVWYNDTLWHLKSGMEEFKKIFGYYPVGLWPSEEAVSKSVIKAVNESGIKWMISDTYVLDKSGYDVIDVGQDYIKNPEYMYSSYLAEDKENDSSVYMVFRDRVISDRIGFVYNTMSTQDAVRDFISYIERASSYFADPQNHIVVVALDGENWMFMNNPSYPNNGRDFLDALYSALENNSNIRCVTVWEYIKAHGYKYKIENLAEGSWMFGDLTTWEGEPDEDTAWNWLAAARRELVNYTKTHGYDENAQKGWESLYPAEGSDWFWWYGTDQTTRDEPMFDHLFKTHLINVYRAIGKNPPVYLTAELSEPAKADKIGEAFTPQLDGVMEEDWNRGFLYKDSDGGYIEEVRITYDPQGLYFLINLNVSSEELISGNYDLAIYFSTPNPENMNVPGINFLPKYGTKVLGFPIRYRVVISFSSMLSSGQTSMGIFRSDGNEGWIYETSEDTCYVKDYIELGISLSDIGLNMGDFVYCSVVIAKDGEIGDIAPNKPMKIQIPFLEKRTYIMEIRDDVGDDVGDGDYVYPTAGDMWPNEGLFDIVDLKIFNTSYVLGFEFHFREMGKVVNGKPIWNPKYCFSHQMINIYIDIDRKVGSGAIDMLEGAYAQVREDFAWEYAISARGWDVYIAKSDGTIMRSGVSAIADFNESSGTWDNNTVTVRVSLSIIGKDFWNYGFVIVVGSQDEYGPGKWRIVNKNVGRWNFGGGTDTIYDPDIIDMITPREANETYIDSRTQTEILSSYSVEEKRFAVLPGIVLPSPNGSTGGGGEEENETLTETVGYEYDITLYASLGIVGFAAAIESFRVFWRRLSKERREKIRKYARISFILFLIFGAMYLVASAPTHSKEGKITIRIWYTFTRGSKEYDVFNRLIEEYQRMHPDIVVKAEWQEYSAAINKFITQANAGNPPDIIRIPNDRLGEVAKMGFLEPLDDYMDPSLWRSYIPEALDAMTYEGKLYALPASYDCLLLVYNKDLINDVIDDENWTVEDMVRIAKNSSAEYGLVFPTTSSYWWFPFQYGFGGEIFRNNKPVVNDEASINATRFIKSLVEEGIMPSTPTDEISMVTYFTSQKAAMIIEGPWKIGEISIAVPNYGLAVLPKAVRNIAPLVGYKGYAIAKDSKYKAAAFDLVKFLTSYHAEKEFAVEAHTSPTRFDVFEDEDVKKDYIIQVMRRQALRGQTYPNVPEMSIVQEKVTEALGKIYEAGMGIEEALNIAEEQILAEIREVEG